MVSWRQEGMWEEQQRRLRERNIGWKHSDYVCARRRGALADVATQNMLEVADASPPGSQRWRWWWRGSRGTRRELESRACRDDE
jgi:hypothetical protein